jgi:hypothetical protein
LKKLTAALACALSALVIASPAAADVSFGVADDHGKYADDGGAAFFGAMGDVGMTENRITVRWDPDQPTSIVETGFLARSLPVARAKGVNVVFALYPTKARLLGDPAKLDQFLAFAELVVRSYPQVTEVIVGNEPNQTFFAPSDCATAPATYVKLLAAAYDRLKPLGVSVVSSLSPRGNDNCSAASNPSWSPVAFVGAMGDAYRALGRTAPLFDVFGFHPYPNQSTDSLDKGYQWPNVGFMNRDRIKQAVWDAFNGTAQPTFEQGLKLKLAEVGWQVGVAPSVSGLYTGAENVAVTSEDVQAQIYADVVRRARCDASIQSVLFFGLYDESNLDRFQAALMRVDKSKRPAYDAVRAAIAQGGCQGAQETWRHRTDVAGAKAIFRDVADKKATQLYWAFSVYGEEDFRYEAALERVTSAAGGASTTLLKANGNASAYFTPLVKFAGQKLAPGYYRYTVSLAATMNPSRTSEFSSEVFKVGTPVVAKAKAKAKPKKAVPKKKNKKKAKAAKKR